MDEGIRGKRVSQAELAAIHGVQPVTIRAWLRKGCPVIERGGRGRSAQYDTAQVARWREEQSALAATGDVSALDTKEATRRKLAAEAVKAEIELGILQGKLVPIDEVGAIVADEYANVRASFLSMPGDIAADLEHRTPAEMQELLYAKVSEILHGLSADGDFATEEPVGAGEAGGAETTA